MEKLFNLLFQFLNNLYSAYSCISVVCSVSGFIALLLVIAGAFAGITQAMVRFGLALYAKKIAIIAGLDDFNDIQND